MFIIFVLLIKEEHEKKCIITVFGVWVEGRGEGRGCKYNQSLIG